MMPKQQKRKWGSPIITVLTRKEDGPEKVLNTCKSYQGGNSPDIQNDACQQKAWDQQYCSVCYSDYYSS
ncbi:MAG: hypothetical protein PHT31_02815 [Candidatus Omnitrophica bacterium]|nr:hypothetical protein [Candidatus Omnitrophota bacterium]